jgi:hypothetical protein
LYGARDNMEVQGRGLAFSAVRVFSSSSRRNLLSIF